MFVCFEHVLNVFSLCVCTAGSASSWIASSAAAAGALGYNDIGRCLDVSFPTSNDVANPQMCAVMLCRLFKQVLGMVTTPRPNEVPTGITVRVFATQPGSTYHTTLRLTESGFCVLLGSMQHHFLGFYFIIFL